MKRIARLLAVVAVGASTLIAAPASVYAEEFTCRGAIGAATFDNIRVPQDATCRLTGTQIQGTLIVERGATLVANGIRLNGNLQAENHASVRLTNGSQVGGSVQIKQGGAASVLNSRVNADIQLDSNTGALTTRGNTVGGSIQVVKNTGGVSIVNNSVNGNLQCKENAPAPTGSGNVVQGVKEDQCASL